MGSVDCSERCHQLCECAQPWVTHKANNHCDLPLIANQCTRCTSALTLGDYNFSNHAYHVRVRQLPPLEGLLRLSFNVLHPVPAYTPIRGISEILAQHRTLFFVVLFEMIP